MKLLAQRNMLVPKIRQKSEEGESNSTYHSVRKVSTPLHGADILLDLIWETGGMPHSQNDKPFRLAIAIAHPGGWQGGRHAYFVEG